MAVRPTIITSYGRVYENGRWCAVLKPGWTYDNGVPAAFACTHWGAGAPPAREPWWHGTKGQPKETIVERWSWSDVLTWSYLEAHHLDHDATLGAAYQTGHQAALVGLVVALVRQRDGAAIVCGFVDFLPLHPIPEDSLTAKPRGAEERTSMNSFKSVVMTQWDPRLHAAAGAGGNHGGW